MDILEYVIADICEVMSYLPYGIMAGGLFGLLYLTVCFVRKHELLSDGTLWEVHTAL